jgi:hypothetical protein
MRSLWLHVSFSVDGNDGWMIEIITMFGMAFDSGPIARKVYMVLVL